MQIAELPIRLPGLNEYQRACRASPFLGAQMKKRDMHQVMAYIGQMGPAKWPVNIEVYYIEPNKKRDKDNVSGYGMKVIGDALVKMGVIPDDNSNYVTKLMQEVVCSDDGEAKIIIRVIEMGDEEHAGVTDEEVWNHINKITNGSVFRPKKETIIIDKKQKNTISRKSKTTTQSNQTTLF